MLRINHSARLLFTSTLLAVIQLASIVPVAFAAPRPNIVIVMADDLGFSDLGCFGGEINTPHLDALAAQGLRMSQFYNTARCCPTRAALLTGLHQHAAGIGHMVGNLGRPSYQGFLNDQCATIAEVLRPAGYKTLGVGKWHVGSARGQWPLDRGFDRYFGTPSGGGFYFKKTLKWRKRFVVLGNDEVDFPDDGYVTDLFTDYALKFVEEAARKQQPFFLYLAHIAPHWPLQAKPDDIRKYEGRYRAGWKAIRKARFEKQQKLKLFRKELKLSDAHPQVRDWEKLSEAEQKDMAHRMAVYAAQVDCIDQNLGRLVHMLKKMNVFENTVIIFLSDNGCSAEGGPGGFRRGDKTAPIGTDETYASAGLEWANVSDTPFRKFKMSVHEGGISSPCIIHWPAGLNRRGEIEPQPGHVIDLLPTCADLTGAVYPPQDRKDTGSDFLPLAGVSLLPAWRGEALPKRPLYWEHQGNKAIRDGDWKLVKSHGGAWELYDLKVDRTETNDLSTVHPQRVATMKALWQTWADENGVASWPVKKRRKP